MYALKALFGIPRRRCEDNINLDLRKVRIKLQSALN